MTSTPDDAAMRDEIIPRLEAIFTGRLQLPAPAADTDLLESGLLDSLQFVDLLAAIERAFDISIPLGDLDFDRLTTLAGLAQLVNERRSPPDDAAAVRHSATRH
jgi:methoxymalonate biosynthesis acyl carrier protein